MAKLTKFKAQQVEFGTHYKIEETNRGDAKIKSITPAFGNIREPGTPETEEIYNGLQLGNVHTLQANKTTNLNIDYYVCNLDGLTEFGMNNDLKLRINVDTKNTNSTTKLRLNNTDYTLLKEYNGTLKQMEAGDFKPNKSYELAYNGNQFVVINITEFGTESDTVLEGKRLAEIIGMEFGGKIQDPGIKTAGKFYYDTVTKFYYECLTNNSLTYNDSSKFRAISNKPISDRIEDLINFGNDTIKFSDGTIIGWGSGFAGSRNREFSNTISTDFLSITSLVAIHVGTVATKTNIIARPLAGNRFAAVSDWENGDKILISYIAIGKWK
ncbi:hypothetical protein [Leptotrichia buccalis]